MIQDFYTFIQSIFGIYTPISVLDSNGEIIDYAVDFGYIASVVIFLVVLYLVVKTIGGLIYEWLR